MTDSRSSDARVRASAIAAGSPATASAATSIRDASFRCAVALIQAVGLHHPDDFRGQRRDDEWRTQVRGRAQHEVPADRDDR